MDKWIAFPCTVKNYWSCWMLRQLMMMLWWWFWSWTEDWGTSLLEENTEGQKWMEMKMDVRRTDGSIGAHWSSWMVNGTNQMHDNQHEWRSPVKRRHIYCNTCVQLHKCLLRLHTFCGLCSGKEVTVNEDEGYKQVNFDKLRTLQPAFQKDGNGNFICCVCDCVTFYLKGTGIRPGIKGPTPFFWGVW